MKVLMLLAIVACCSGLEFYEECAEGMDNFATRLVSKIKGMAASNEAIGPALMLDQSAADEKGEKDFEIQKALAIILAGAWDEEDIANFVMAHYISNLGSIYDPLKACPGIRILETLDRRLQDETNEDNLRGTCKVSARNFREFFPGSNAIFIALMNSPYSPLKSLHVAPFLDTDIRVAISMDDDKVIQDGIPYPQPNNASLVIPTVLDEIDEVLRLKECIVERCASADNADVKGGEHVVVTSENDQD